MVRTSLCSLCTSKNNVLTTNLSLTEVLLRNIGIKLKQFARGSMLSIEISVLPAVRRFGWFPGSIAIRQYNYTKRRGWNTIPSTKTLTRRCMFVEGFGLTSPAMPINEWR